MLKGHIDALTTADFIEGWAFDAEDPARVLHVEIVTPEEERLADGFANLYRPDLVEARFGLGWCAFRLRLGVAAEALRERRLALREAGTGAVLHAGEAWRMREDLEQPFTSFEQVVAADPGVLTSLAQLRGCEPLLAGFVARRGVGEFVRAAYVYVLGRPVDAQALSAYGRMLRTGAITPLGLLSVLFDSEEFRARPRALAAPTAPGFVFRA